MSSMEIIVAGLKLRIDRPTTVSFTDLRNWVIWQFPQREKKGYRGAVRPALADQMWLPAIIQDDRERVRIYAHVQEKFSSPETAVAYFAENKEAGL